MRSEVFSFPTPPQTPTGKKEEKGRGNEPKGGEVAFTPLIGSRVSFRPMWGGEAGGAGGGGAGAGGGKIG